MKYTIMTVLLILMFGCEPKKEAKDHIPSPIQGRFKVWKESIPAENLSELPTKLLIIQDTRNSNEWLVVNYGGGFVIVPTRQTQPAHNPYVEVGITP
jgi:hypothetical protein